MNRRGFLDWMIRIAGTALGAVVVYPVFRFLLTPGGPESDVRRVAAAKAGEIPPNDARIFRFGPEPGILVHTETDGYRAMSAVCTHLQCTVQYRREQKDIWCACHNGVYDLEGRNISGPPPRPLERYTVRLEGEDIVVEK